jgi:hypothetical protein
MGKRMNMEGLYKAKGLGFLSVFKFGKFVEWKTNKNNGYSFSVDYDQLVNADDVSEFEIDLVEDDRYTHGN